MGNLFTRMSEEKNSSKKTKMDPLNKEQVDYALELIKELHPLENTPYHQIYPALKYLCCCCVCLPTLSGREPDVPAEQEPLLDDEEGEKAKGDTVMIGGREVKKKKGKKRKN